MNMEKTIPEIVKAAAEEFRQGIDQFNLATSEDTGFPERNLSFYFANAFLKHYPNGFVFHEVTFKIRKHLDTLLIADDFAIALECKVLLNKDRVRQLSEDSERLDHEVVPLMADRFKKNSPQRWYTMLLCETWWEERLDWWTDEKDHWSGWDRPACLNSYYLKTKFICNNIKFPDKDRLWSVYWLYGIKKYVKA